jgi:hypothetical protein
MPFQKKTTVIAGLDPAMTAFVNGMEAARHRLLEH